MNFKQCLAHLVGLLLFLQVFATSALAQPGLTRYACKATTAAGVQIPFRLVVEQGQSQAFLVNGRETLRLPLARKEADTAVYTLAVFDAELRVKQSGSVVAGVYVRYDAAQGTVRVPFVGQQSKEQPIKTLGPEMLYDVVFADADGTNPYQAVGHLAKVVPSATVKGGPQRMLGTFETSTGDYRFLEGEQTGDSLWLSTFDGGHLYLFTAKIKGDSIVRGQFYSTGAGHERFAGKQNAQASLPDELQQVAIVSKEPVHVSVTDTAGVRVSTDDARFKGKPMVLQVMGSWCPNCMDETRFLADWYKSALRGDVQVLGLAYERKAERAYWKGRLSRVISYQKVPYSIGYAGKANRDSAAASLPFLSAVKSFPTTIFLNRRHEVVAVHTGYSGPATGKAFVEYRTKFNELILTILK